jgi:SAM-dependent methyltransferase
MRSVLSRSVPEAHVLAGTAENVPVRGGAVDGVTVAQAFHWFDGSLALNEIRRVLKPQGRLVLVWNVRDLAQPLQTALEAVMSRYRGASPSQASGAWREPFRRSNLFGALHRSTFRMEHHLRQDELVARALSTSFIARLPQSEQQRVTREVADLCPEGGHVSMGYLTDVYWCAPK